MTVKRGGLGRNLSALLGTPSNISVVSPVVNNTPLKLAVTCLQPGKYQPRSVMDETGLDELANSIKQQGLLQPVVVRELANGQYEIIAGERRWRASQLAGLQEIPVVLKQVDDETAMAMALVENLQREDLNPIDQARAMARLHEEFDLTHQQIAELLSKSRTAVSNYLRLMSLAEEVIRMVENGDLDMGHARALLALDKEPQIQAAKLIIAKNLSVRETERLVNRIKQGKPAPLLQEIPQTTQQQVKLLGQYLHSKIQIKSSKNGKGSLIIHYENVGSLEMLIQQIMDK